MHLLLPSHNEPPQTAVSLMLVLKQNEMDDDVAWVHSTFAHLSTLSTLMSFLETTVEHLRLDKILALTTIGRQTPCFHVLSITQSAFCCLGLRRGTWLRGCNYGRHLCLLLLFLLLLLIALVSLLRTSRVVMVAFTLAQRFSPDLSSLCKSSGIHGDHVIPLHLSRPFVLLTAESGRLRNSCA